MMRRLAVGTALAAALILSIGGCGGSGDSEGSDDEASPKAADTLAAAVTKTGGTTMKIVLAGD